MQRPHALKIQILERGLSQREVARMAGIPEGRLSDIVRGWRDARPEEAEALSRVLSTVPVQQEVTTIREAL